MCALIGVTEKENPLVYYNMKLLNDTAPYFVHPCPYTVRDSCRSQINNEFYSPQEVVAQNMTFNTDLLPTIFFNGDYKLLWYYTTKSGESIGNMTVYLNLKTTNRDSFG
jgi:hypothetical protein